MCINISLEHRKLILCMHYKSIMCICPRICDTSRSCDGSCPQVGAQVMLLRNLELTGNDRMLVNGSRGVITRFITKTVSPHAC